MANDINATSFVKKTDGKVHKMQKKSVNGTLEKDKLSQSITGNRNTFCKFQLHRPLQVPWALLLQQDLGNL